MNKILSLIKTAFIRLKLHLKKFENDIWLYAEQERLQRAHVPQFFRFLDVPFWVKVLRAVLGIYCCRILVIAAGDFFDCFFYPPERNTAILNWIFWIFTLIMLLGLIIEAYKHYICWRNRRLIKQFNKNNSQYNINLKIELAKNRFEKNGGNYGNQG